jgi:hypothetical protein
MKYVRSPTTANVFFIEHPTNLNAILLVDLGTEIAVGLDPGAHVVNDCTPDDAGTSATVLGALPQYGKLT